ncbi:MAG: hypothetical protein H6674_04320 [Dehalococcoidia bacterium]|nr:hypothetical protein [Dehalococcoidia bacterium]MCB9482460.1 hypothetical protein [Dehalococcoidia bacterium]MCB9491279.1 hypothetical protein [Dehalococcoidia bacterium]
MKAIGKDIGEQLDGMHKQIEDRLRVETGRLLWLQPFEGGSFSNVEWRKEAVVIQLHNGVPTHALPHVLGVALQHVRQRMDLYPGVVAPDTDLEGGPLLRSALRELVMGPEAEMHLEPLGLDTQWEDEQRHQGLKEMLRDAPNEWDIPGMAGNSFAALQYARFTLEHPAELWEPLKEQFTEKLPSAAERGEQVVTVVKQSGWKTPGACLQSLVSARDALTLQPYALIEDRQKNRKL